MSRYSEPFKGAMEFGFVDVVETWTYKDGRKALVIHFNVQPPKVPEEIDFDNFGLKLEEFKDNKAKYLIDWEDWKKDDDDWDDWDEEEDEEW